MGVASGCGEQEAGVASGSGWNLWVWHSTYPYSSCICSFLQQHLFFFQQHPYFLLIFNKCFSFLFKYFL